MQRRVVELRECTRALAVAAAFIALYGLCRQASLHGQDSCFLVGDVATGHLRNDQHFLFLPIASAWHALLRCTGASVHTSLQWLSVFGTGAGLGFLWCACRNLGATPYTSTVVTALVGVCPSVLHYATIVEFHGLAFLGYGLAWWAWAACRRAPTMRRAFWLGASTALAAGLHAFAHAFAVLLVVWLWLGRGVERPRLRVAAVALLAHAALTAPTFLLGVSDRPAFAKARATVGIVDVLSEPWGSILWREWGWPYLPVSLAVLFAIVGRLPAEPSFGAARREAVALTVAVMVWLVPTGILLGAGVDERGAYFAGLALPAAWLLVHALPRAGHAFVLAIAAAAAAWTWAHPERPPPDSDFGRGVLAIVAERPSFVVLGTRTERDAIVVQDPTVHVQLLDDWLLDAWQKGNADLEHFTAALGVLADSLAGAGVRLVFAESTRQTLRELREEPVRVALTEALSRFVQTPIEAAGFRGFVVTRKQVGR